MPRPIKTDRPVEKNISLPTSIVARVELELFSELEGKVPFGAWQKFLIGLIENHFAQRDAPDFKIWREEFLQRAGFSWGWENLESSARAVVLEAYKQITGREAG